MNQMPLTDRRRGGLPRGRRASDKERPVFGLNVEELYEAGRIGSAFGLLLLAPASAALVTLVFINWFGIVPLAIALQEGVEREVRRGLALFLIGGWGALAVSAGRQTVERRARGAPFGARLLASVVGGTVPGVLVAETIRRLVTIFGETPFEALTGLIVSTGAGAYLAAGLTLVRAFRRGDLGRRLAAWGLLAALLLAAASTALAVRAGG